ncbi:MAG: PilZ domain-containing protein [Candidatus Rokubacteria bacterium]|nr:PilZ domain-containing protein [Candidatus Rokubacteria bacterium]
MDERRRHARTNVSWPIRLWVDEGSLVGRTEDTSEGGICVAIAPTASVKLGSSYRVDVLASHIGPFSVIGEARHVDDRKVGFETDRLLPLVE